MEQIRAIAPPIARDCIVAEVRKLAPQGLLETQPRSNDEQASILGEAIRLVGYVRSSCFEQVHVDSTREGKKEAFFNANSFVHAFRAHGLAHPPYHSSEFARLLDAYNAHQACLYGLVGPCKAYALNGVSALAVSNPGKPDPPVGFDFGLPPIGHSKISATDFKRHVALTFRITARSHTEGIDAGEDRFRTLLVRKADLQIVGDHDARLLVDSPSDIAVLATDARASCAGMSFGDNLLVLRKVCKTPSTTRGEIDLGADVS